jgi:hypothetical protein
MCVAECVPGAGRGEVSVQTDEGSLTDMTDMIANANLEQGSGEGIVGSVGVDRHL